MEKFILNEQKINKIHYNVYDINSDKDKVEEEIIFQIQAKKGISENDSNKIALFFEVSVEGKIDNTNTYTRDLLLEIMFEFTVKNNKSQFDKEITLFSLKIINDIITNLTSLDGNNPLDFTNAIEKFVKEN